MGFCEVFRRCHRWRRSHLTIIARSGERRGKGFETSAAVIVIKRKMEQRYVQRKQSDESTIDSSDNNNARINYYTED
jgi:hypothetical protein